MTNVSPVFAEYITDDAKHYLADRYGYKEFVAKPATAAAIPQG